MSWLDRFFTSRNYGTIQDSGVALPPQPIFNFVGFDTEDDPDNNRTTITNTGGASSGFIGYVEIPMADADHSVTTDEANDAILDCTGALTADRSLIFDQPSAAGSKPHIVKNNTTGGFNISIELVSGGGGNVILLGPGLSQMVEIQPTGVFNSITGI